MKKNNKNSNKWIKGAFLVAALGAASALGINSLAASDASVEDNQTIAAASQVFDIVKDPTDIPAPINRHTPETVQLELEAKELVGELDNGTTYKYWTFNGTVPGPLARVRVGDTVEVTMKNNASSMMVHNVDFHAVTGPGGGAAATFTAPGGETGFSFKAMKPGLYVYHCATPMVASHIANGMYGLILVEPENGLDPVDHEFYVMQGEIYTEQPYGTRGMATESYDKMMDEQPEYYVFNGAVGALTREKPMEIKTGETVRIFFGVGGPNKTSGFHVIGEIFDKAYQHGSLSSPPLLDTQSITVPPGSAGMVEFKVEVPGTYVLVDHALVRMRRGLMGHIKATGPEQPDVFKVTTPNSP
jgi:nitrite reductase (NO-forming)